MTLSFPNQSRGFDPKGRRIRFWGHHKAMEVSLFIEVAAIQKLMPKTPLAPDFEAEMLKIFDAAHEQIHRVAQKVYSYPR